MWLVSKQLHSRFPVIINIWVSLRQASVPFEPSELVVRYSALRQGVYNSGKKKTQGIRDLLRELL